MKTPEQKQKLRRQRLRPWDIKNLVVSAVLVLAGCVTGAEEASVDKSQDWSSNTEAEVSDSNETAGQENARGSAESYLKYSAFSRSGLIGQLEFEGHSTEDASYAVDAVNADWNEQAARSAKNYLEYSSFSRSGLIDQLLFEGFTQSQAEYGVSTTGL